MATRVLNTPFQISATQMAWVRYTLHLTATGGVLSANDILVQLLADAHNPPTTEINRRYLKASLLAGAAGINLQAEIHGGLDGWVSPGAWVLLKTTGAGSAMLLAQDERMGAFWTQ